MADCNKCKFSKCCKDVGSNLKECSYYEKGTAWIKDYLQVHQLWKKEYDSNILHPSDEFLAYVLKVRQEKNVETAKEELKWTTKIIGVVLLVVAIMLAFHFGNTYRWSTFLQDLISAKAASLACADTALSN